MYKLILLFSFSLLLNACATNPQTVSGVGSITEADEKMVVSCSFVGTFAGRSMFGGVIAGYSERKSLNNAKAQASAKGATHYVAGVTVGANFQHGSRVSIKGYRC